jgi:hypothetical protein
MSETIPAEDPRAVNHPIHYNSLPAKCLEFGNPIECIDVIEHMTLNLGNCVKYIWRAGIKDPTKLIEDLEKARWYLDREIARLKEKAEREAAK